MRISFAMLTLLLAASGLAAQGPSSRSAVIDVTDGQAIAKAMNQHVIVQGVVERAEWSRTGKVMNIEFAGAPDGLLAVVFDTQRARLDEAFAGDLAAALTGATVRLRGRITPYGGRVEAMKDRPQMIIEDGHQITILKLAPTTQPTGGGGNP